MTKIKQEINSIIYPVITICNNIFVILSNLYTVVYKSIPWVIVSKEKELWQPNHEKQRTLKQTNKCFQTCLVLTSTCSLSLRIEYCVKTTFFSFISFIILSILDIAVFDCKLWRIIIIQNLMQLDWFNQGSRLYRVGLMYVATM